MTRAFDGDGRAADDTVRNPPKSNAADPFDTNDRRVSATPEEDDDDDDGGTCTDSSSDDNVVFGRSENNRVAVNGRPTVGDHATHGVVKRTKTSNDRKVMVSNERAVVRSVAPAAVTVVGLDIVNNRLSHTRLTTDPSSFSLGWPCDLFPMLNRLADVRKAAAHQKRAEKPTGRESVGAARRIQI